MVAEVHWSIKEMSGGESNVVEERRGVKQNGDNFKRISREEQGSEVEVCPFFIFHFSAFYYWT